MTASLILILTPIVLFVVAFLYETFLSFRRLVGKQANTRGYVAATWEVTHTLLVAGVVILVMLFTDAIVELGSAIFTAAFLALSALTVRTVLYGYIFYVRRNQALRNWIDWLFACTHVVAALLLVVVVAQAMWFLYTAHPQPNTEFLPYFVPGLVGVVVLVAIPVFVLYRTKDE